MVVIAHVDDLCVAGERKEREWRILELRKEFTLKLVDHLERPGDQANFVGKVIAKVKDGFAVKTSEEYVTKLIKTMECQPETTNPVVTPIMKRAR